ncbi:MAG: hypothetical protein ABUK11_03080 [Mariprofundaceae bacterium]
MDQITIEPNVWIITEGNTPAYYIYELVSGSVTIYRHGAKVNTHEVKAGGDTIFLGIIAAMRDDRFNVASVRTESEVKVIRHSIDQVWGILKNEIPADLKFNVNTMIEAISIKNEIDSLNDQLAAMPKVTVQIPGDVRGEAKTVINEVVKLYSGVVK